MAATFAGIPVFSRRKSIERYLRACPPPRCQEVISPWELRPPVRFFDSLCDFSGISFVISLLSSIVRNRRDGVYGLNVFSAIVASCSEQSLQILRVLDHLFARCQPDVRLLPIAAKTFRAPAAAELSVIDRGAHVVDLHLEDALYGFLDFGLRRVLGDFEHDRVLRLLHAETLLGDDRPPDH